MASMKEVAKLAGVSISTVSRVISGNIPVNDETQIRVNDAINKIGYRPNLIAQGLRSKNTRLIGLIVPSIALSNFPRIINSMEKVASAHNLGLLIANTKNDPECESTIVDSMLRRNIDGIIFSRVSDNSKAMKMVSQQATPAVVIDRTLKHETIPNVILNNFRAGEIAAQHLWDAGCRNIACITGDQNICLCRSRLDGFQSKLRELGYELPPENIFSGKFTSQTGVDGVGFFLQNKTKIDGIWGQNDLITLGAMSKLQREGYKVPLQIKLIGMDDLESSTMCYPSVTTISQPYDQMAEVAFDLINQQSHGIELEQKHYVLEPSLVIRESTE